MSCRGSKRVGSPAEGRPLPSQGLLQAPPARKGPVAAATVAGEEGSNQLSTIHQIA